MAHYDSVPGSPGASDDGSGVATLLETARALRAGAALQRDVIFLFTDGEEVGLLGARAFVNEHPWAREVKVVLNFEARGQGGPSTMFETSDDNGWLIREFAKASPNPIANSLSYEFYKRLDNNTDLTAFKQAGFAGLNFAYIGGINRYHTARDSVENLDERSLQHHGSYALALTRHFGNADFSNPGKGNAVYFNPLGTFLITYPAWLAVPLTLLSLLLLAAVVFIFFKKKLLTVRGIILGMAALLASAIAAWLLTSLMGLVLRYLRGGDRNVPWGEPYNSELYVLSLVVLSVAVTLTFYLMARAKTTVADLTLGAMLWWALLGIAVTALMPGGSYLITWPLLFVLVGLAVRFVWRQKPLAAWAVQTLCVIPSLLLLSPLIQQLFAAFTLAGAAQIAVLIVLTLGLVIPPFQFMFDPFRWTLPLTALALSLGLAIAGLLTAKFDQQRPVSNSIFYGLNADTANAVWGSMDGKPDDWTTQFLTSHPAEVMLVDLFPQANRSFITAAAPAAALPAPNVELLSDGRHEGTRTLRLRVSSPRRASVIFLFADADSEVTGGAVDGKSFEEKAEKNRQPSRPWGLSFYALPVEGIDVTMNIKSSTPIKMRAVDRSDGLQGIQSTPFKPRPDYMIPIPSTYSDAVFVGKTFTFP